MAVAVRLVRSDDIPALDAVFSPPVGRETAAQLVAQEAGASSLYVAWLDNRPVGRVYVDWAGPRREPVRARYADCPEIHTLLVLESARGRGIGARLLSACEAEARRRGVRRVGLGADPERADATNLYLRQGYQPSEIDRYEDVYEVRDPSGRVVERRAPARWLVKLLPEADAYFADYVPDRPRETLAATIRPTTPADSRAITEIWAERHGEDPADFYDQVHEALSKPRGKGWAAEVDGRVVAYAQLRWMDDHLGVTGWILTGVNTRVEFRRRRLGRALTEVRLDWLRGQGATQVFCVIDTTNPASIDLHEALGFELLRRDVRPASSGRSDLYRAILEPRAVRPPRPEGQPREAVPAGPFRYVGPEEVRARWADRPPGRVVRAPADVRAWIDATGQRRDADGRYVATFVVDEAGALRIEDYGYEHVACAGGGGVLGAGVAWFADPATIEAISNQSTGYCPDPGSWPAVAAALHAAGLVHPGRFTQSFVFRRCPACGQRNLVKDGWFVCGLCDTPLPERWNFD